MLGPGQEIYKSLEHMRVTESKKVLHVHTCMHTHNGGLCQKNTEAN